MQTSIQRVLYSYLFLCYKRVAEGIKEEDTWRLFVQILEALAHMAGLGIVSHLYFLLESISRLMRENLAAS